MLYRIALALLFMLLPACGPVQTDPDAVDPGTGWVCEVGVTARDQFCRRTVCPWDSTCERRTTAWCTQRQTAPPHPAAWCIATEEGCNLYRDITFHGASSLCTQFQ